MSCRVKFRYATPLLRRPLGVVPVRGATSLTNRRDGGATLERTARTDDFASASVPSAAWDPCAMSAGVKATPKLPNSLLNLRRLKAGRPFMWLPV